VHLKKHPACSWKGLIVLKEGHAALAQRPRKMPRYAALFFIGLCEVLLLAGTLASASGQRMTVSPAHPNLKNGKTVWNNGCIACHGADGKGAPESSTVFTRPDTWPDMSRCDQTTPEPDSAYKAVILHGGRGLGFSQIMPAFGDLLTDEQVDDVIAYLRTFCKNDKHFPLGVLNLPRAIVTEKAFPEDELVISTAANVSGPGSWTTDVIHEQTFAGKNQLEVDVPVNYARINGDWTSGVGDITIGMKREIFSSERAGSILSLQGGILLPTGDSHRGFGAGTTQFEPFAAYDQLITNRTFAQFELGADLPVDSSISPRSLFFRSAFGGSFAPDHGLGRLYSPMIEFVAKRDYMTGASTQWDVLPEMQVTVSRRQHIRAAAGYRKPFTDVSGRAPQVEFYVLWDWAEGHFWDGWR
jgi:mono/diheme cytochrome c family protein